MIRLNSRDLHIQPFPIYNIEYANGITLGITSCNTLHESHITAHKVKYPGFLFRTPVTLDPHISQRQGKTLMKYQLENLPVAGFKHHASLDPVLGIFNTKTSFRLVTDHKIMKPVYIDHVT